MYGIKRGTTYGYSMYEFEIMGCETIADEFINVYPELIEIDTSAAWEDSITIYANLDWNLVADDWINIQKNNGTDTAFIVFNVTANNETSKRTGTITVTAGNFTRTINVTQKQKLITGTDMSAFRELQMYPNPANKEIIIDGPEQYSLIIYNLNGQLILERLNISGTEFIDISWFNRGVYVVKFCYAGGTQTKKIIVE